MNILRYTNRGIAAWFICSTLFFATEQLSAEVQTIRTPGQQHLSIVAVSSDAYAGLDVINLDAMNEMRGGFSFGGLELKFGATLSTLIDNFRYETVFNISEAGIEVVSQMLGNLAGMNEAVAALTNSSAAGVTLVTDTSSAAQSSVAGTATSTTTAPATTAVLVGPGTELSLSDVTPANVKLDGLNGFSGIVVNNNNGIAAALHKLTKDAAISLVATNASGVRVRQNLDVSVHINDVRSARMAAKAAALSRMAGRRLF